MVRQFYRFDGRRDLARGNRSAEPRKRRALMSGTDLSWALAFPAANVTFDVYLDPNETPVTNLDASARVSADQTGFNYDPNPALQPDTTYYWRVVTKVDGNPVQTSEVRHFLTQF